MCLKAYQTWKKKCYSETSHCKTHLCLILYRTVVTPSNIRGYRRRQNPTTSKKIDINFPLGRPTADTIESLCSNQKLRPLYTVKCLPGSGYEGLGRQAKTINRIEKGFKQCCKKKQGVLDCAEQKVKQKTDQHKYIYFNLSHFWYSCPFLYFSGRQSSIGFARLSSLNRGISNVVPCLMRIDTTVSKTLLLIHIIM